MANETVLNLPKSSRWRKHILAFLTILGPGLTVMLADTDAGSIITAAQSGAQWGYKLLALQLSLIPVLYFVQELTCRIGIVTGRGHAELIKERFGTKWAWISTLTLFVAAIGALVTEFSGIAGAGLLFGISQWISVPVAALILIIISASGQYLSVERTAIAIGLFELIFIPAVFYAHPDPTAMLHGLIGTQPLYNSDYWLLIAANVGAVIMPWMIFYQQGAVVDKKLSAATLKYSRIDTFMGSIVTQIIMALVLILAAATLGQTHSHASLSDIQQIALALEPAVGSFAGKVLFAIGVTAAALIATIVVSLASSWAFGEMLGVSCSLDCSWKQAPVFYSVYTGGIIIAAILVLTGIPLISLTIAVEVMNTLLLPIVLGFLLALGWKALPEKYKLHLWEKTVLLAIYVLVCSLGIYTAAVQFMN
jgi:NRAMP (natural resistance-associated macrophage protein)-like metal ion transporter